MRLFLLILATSLLIAVDFGLKYFFHGPFQKMAFSCPNPSDCLFSYAPILDDIFGIRLSYNTGIAFSLPIEWIFLQVLTVAIIIGLLWYYFRREYTKKSVLLDAAFVMIFAGAFSHAYERIFVGYVVDFLALKNFAIFNFADILITVGAILLLIHTIFYERI